MMTFFQWRTQDNEVDADAGIAAPGAADDDRL